MDEASALCDRVAIVVDGRVTAVGAPDELVRRRSSRRVTFTVAAGTDLSGVERLDAVQDVTTSPRHDGVRVAAATDDPDGVLRRVAVMGDLAARDLTVESQTLEDVFLALAETSTPETRDRRTTRTGRRNR
jgi:ABC-2 type transport system ATP-binding protein